MHVTITAVQEFLVLSQALLFQMECCGYGKALTSKEAFLLFSSGWCRQWSTWAFIVGRQPNIATTTEWIYRLEPSQKGRLRRSVDWNIGLSPGPTHGIQRVSKGCRSHSSVPLLFPDLLNSVGSRLCRPSVQDICTSKAYMSI